MADYDSPWKEALDEYFPAFIGLFFPAMHQEIDWARNYESLDNELQQIAPDSERGRRIVDKLVKVWRLDGGEEWILVHIEVQGHEETRFAERMFGYYCRLVDHYNKPVVSIAVLADENPGWRPERFRRSLWNCTAEFTFPIVKLLEYAGRGAELEGSDNPFAKFVLAHLKALETKRDDETRYIWKVRLIRGLFERGLQPEEVRKLFRLIDWVMALPPALARQFRDELSAIQKEKRMPYVTSIERLAKEEGWKQGREEGREKGREEGREEGLRRGILALLGARFGAAGLRLMPEIDSIHDSALLEAILDRAGQITAPEQLRDCWK